MRCTAAADKQALSGADWHHQNDILKGIRRAGLIFGTAFDAGSIRPPVTPRFNSISIAGAHLRDAGCTAVEEMAYTLANGFAYVDELIRRGGDVAKFARRLSFFFYVHMDLFEEACKFRSGRRVWAKLLRERYGVTDEKALHFRFGVVCGGSSLTSAQPYNNIVRVAIDHIPTVLCAAQSIFTSAYDEAFQIPTEFSAEIALRPQQIVQHDSGVAATVDPPGGSYYVA